MDKVTQAALSLAHHRLLAYSVYQYKQFIIGDHLRELADKLEKIERGEIKRLIVTMPPRFGKSLLCTQLFPAWFLGRHPDKQIITACYGDELARDFGRKVRNFCETPEYQAVFDTRLAEDSKSIGKFNTDKDGAYIATGIGGAITGRGADLLIIDDPVRNRQDADSETIRAKIWEWYSSVARTRLMPDASIVVIMTRWHKEDLVGRLLEQEGWEVLHFPAETDGKSLWPDYWPIEALNEIKRDVDNRDWWCLYQGVPSDPTNQVFDSGMFRYWEELPTTPLYCMTVDPAFTKKKTSDYSCIMVTARSAGTTYIIDYVNEKLNPDELINRIIEMYRKWKPVYLGIESYAAQNVIGYYLKEKASQENLRIHYQEIKQTGTKEDKISRLLPPLRDGKILWKKHHTELEKQFVEFPQGKHDDILDALQMVYEFNTGNVTSTDYLESIRQFYNPPLQGRSRSL